MALGDMLCPICNLVLGVISAVVRPGTNTDRDGAVNGHIHIEMSGTYVCLNGHRWEATGSYLLERRS